MSSSQPYVLRLTVVDEGDGANAHLELAQVPAFKRAAAIEAAACCLQEAEAEMREQVTSLNARRKLSGG